MKHPSKTFLQNIATRYRQISTHKVAKIQLLGKKVHYTKFWRIHGVENEVFAPKTVENERFSDESSLKIIFTE